MDSEYIEDLLISLRCPEDEQERVLECLKATVEDINNKGKLSQNYLYSQIQLYSYIRHRLLKLLDGTCQYVDKIQNIVGPNYNFLNEEKLQAMKTELAREAMIFVTGSINAGKSSVINELLRNTDNPYASLRLPDKETRCTARITKVSFTCFRLPLLMIYNYLVCCLNIFQSNTLNFCENSYM